MMQYDVWVEFCLALSAGRHALKGGFSRYLGSGAIAAYELANPVLLIIGAVSSMLAAGIQVTCSKSLAMGSREETNRNYSTAVFFALVISAVFTIVVFLLRDVIAHAVGAGSNEQLFKDTREYMAGFVIGAPGAMIALVMAPFLQMAGKSTLLVAAVAGMTVSDVVFDLLNVRVFKGGMFGMGLASSLSYYVAVLIAIFYFLRPKCEFHYSQKLVSRKKLMELLRGGVPTAVNTISSVVLVFALNWVLLQTGGAAAVAAYAVISGIGGAANAISTGIGGVSLTLSGILFNEEDQNGLKGLLKALLRYGVILGVAVGILLALLAPVFVGLFVPKAGEAQSMAVWGVRLFAVGLLPCCIVNAVKSYYQGTGRVGLCEIISVAECALLPLISSIVLSAAFGIRATWLFFALGEVLTVALIFVHAAAKTKERRIPDMLMLLDERFGVSEDERMEVVIHSMADVIEAAEAAGKFCLSRDESGKFANRIALCVEEMASNTVLHGFKQGGSNYLSVRILHKGDKWVLRFRDDCTAFDPLHYVPPEGAPDALGIRLLLGMADEAMYAYSLNMNNLTLVLRERHAA